MSKSYNLFKEKLDAEHKFPSRYMFKFIVPQGKEDQLIELFPTRDWKWTTRSTKSGSYISFTSQVIMDSSDDVIEVYKKAHTIEGIIAL